MRRYQKSADGMLIIEYSSLLCIQPIKNRGRWLSASQAIGLEMQKDMEVSIDIAGRTAKRLDAHVTKAECNL